MEVDKFPFQLTKTLQNLSCFYCSVRHFWQEPIARPTMTESPRSERMRKSSCSEIVGFTRLFADKLLILLEWFSHEAVPVEAMNLLFCFEVVDMVFFCKLCYLSPDLASSWNNELSKFPYCPSFRTVRTNLWHACCWARKVIICRQYFTSNVTKVRFMATELSVNLEPGRSCREHYWFIWGSCFFLGLYLYV